MSARPSPPVISVLISFFNAGPFLDEAVASVFTQTFPDWELLLLDDGSTDQGSAAAREYAARDSRVRYLEHPGHANRGLSATLNFGLREARGIYAAPLDADDVWLPRKLEEQVALLDAFPDAAMVFGRNQYWYSWTGRKEDRFRDSVPPLGIEPHCLIPQPRLLERMIRRLTPVPCPSGVALRRDAAERVGGFEESFLVNYSDQAFYAKLLLKEPAVASRAVWIRYRRHPGSAVARLKGSGREDSARIAFLDWLGDYGSRVGQDFDLVRQAVEDELTWERSRREAPGAVLRLKRRGKAVTRRLLPPGVRYGLRRLFLGAPRLPSPGRVRFGDLRRLSPLSRRWGADRGKIMDRFYIEDFLANQSGDIRGRVLEIGDDTYTWRFGGVAVMENDVLDVRQGNPNATIVGDLVRAEIPSDRFDCIIFTQTLHLFYEPREAVRTLARILKPGGVLLATVPGITPVGRAGDWGESWHWSFTELSARRLFSEFFGEGSLTVESKGNLLSAAGFLYGIAAEELTPAELAHFDSRYPVSVCVRAVKALGPAA